METCDPIGTPMEIKDKLDLDQNGTLVDAIKYRSMIGALMYLTSIRLDIVHATCLCARYQAKPTVKHLKEVKGIFRYLRGTYNMGLCYTKDSGFKLTGFLDADYAGCKDTFKSTSIGTQFLGENQNWRDLPRDTPLDRIEVLRSTRFYQLSHSEIVDIEKVAVHSSLWSPNNKMKMEILIESTPNSSASNTDNAMYSAFAKDIAVQSCFFDIQLISLSPRNYISPNVLLRVSRQPAWLASEKAVSLKLESFRYQ
ncbi:hypothetical protein Tco_1259206, partial [Tanacetum coccineum]